MVRISDFLNQLSSVDSVYLDSSILIYHLEQMLPYHGLTLPFYKMIQEGRLIGHTSVLTFLEINVKPYQLNQPQKALDQIAVFKDSSHLFIHEINLDVADRASKLRAKYKLKTPDAIHAACSLICKCKVLLGNDKEFKKIKEISYLHLDDFI